jgi:hypothetical protein
MLFQRIGVYMIACFRISLNVCAAHDCTDFKQRFIDESFVTEMEQEMTIVSASRDICHAQDRLDPCSTFPCKKPSL